MSLTAHTPAEAVLPVLNDPERQQAIEDTGLLTHGGDPTMDRLARLASVLVDAPRAFVTLVTDDRQHLPGAVRHDDPADTERDQPLTSSLCQFAVATAEPLMIPDSRQNPLVRQMEPVRSGQIGAYAGVPLRTEEGHVLGTLCVVDRRPREWNQEHLVRLEDLTALAAQDLQQRIASTRERRIRRLAEQLAQQVPPMADAAESLVALAEDQDEPRLQRYAALTRSRVEPLVTLARRLQEATPEEKPAGPPARGRVDLRRIVESAVRGARAATGTDALRLEGVDFPLPVRCDGLALERSIVHVLVTALQHSGGDQPVALRLGRSAPGAGADRGDATLTIVAEDSRVSTGELARVVSRFHEATCDEAAAAEAARPAAIRIAGGAVTAQSGTVRGQAHRGGRLTVQARWALDGTGQATAVQR